MLTVNLRALVIPSALCLAFIATAGCGGRSGSTQGAASSFRVLSISVPNNGTWQINRPIEFVFDRDIDFSSVSLNTISIAQPNGAPARGEFRLKNSKTVVFQPACPTLPDFSDAGLLADADGVTYLVTVLGSNQGGSTVRSIDGRPLTSSQSVTFTTPASVLLDPTILFLDPQLGPPNAIVRSDSTTLAATYVEVGGDSSVAARRYFEPRAIPDPDLGATTPAGFDAPLNLYSASETQIAIVVALNQPVDPSASNISPTNIDLQYLAGSSGGIDNWVSIAHTVELDGNCSESGAQVRVTPTGIMPQGRTVRVVLGSNFRDLVGDFNVVPTIIGSFPVSVATDPGTSTPGDGGDEALEEFTSSGSQPGSREDTSSQLSVTGGPAAVPRAIWSSDGRLTAGFAFDGTGGIGGNFDWVVGNADGSPDTFILDTSFSTITNLAQTATQTVVNGRVDVRSLWVRRGATLIIQGTNPCRILCSGSVPTSAPGYPVGTALSSVLIQGTVKCNGSNNRGVVSFNTATIPEQGAAGQCGGGDGGTGNFLTTQSTPQGQAGFGAFDVAGLGGQGGESGFTSLSNDEARRPGGGGGGVFGPTQFELTRPTCADQRIVGMDAENGFNGAPTANGALRGVGFTPPLGGAKGTSPFVDTSANNDFWGTMITSGGQIIQGELTAPWAGAGGGGGGSCTRTATFPSNPFTNLTDQKGAGGGGGAGSLTILALGDIRIGAGVGGFRGRIEVDGGTGGGGENTNNLNRIGGGSGGGSGGHLILQSASQIDMTTVTSTSTTQAAGLPPINWGGLFAKGGQGGAGENNTGGAMQNGAETLSGQDSLGWPNSYPAGSACAVAPIQSPPNDYTTGTVGGAANPVQFQITNNTGLKIGAGGDGGPGIIQFHTPALSDIKTPTSVGVVMRNVCFPLPVGATPQNASTPAAWNQLLPIFGRYSAARSKWIPLGAASVDASTTTDTVSFLFGGTDPLTGLIDRTGSGTSATVLSLPAILSGVVSDSPTEPFITTDRRTVVFDAGALADDIYKRNASLLKRFQLKFTPSGSGFSPTFEVSAATYDPALDQLRVSVASSGTPLAGISNGFTVELIPRFFRVVTEGTNDAYPATAEIRIKFQAAPANSIGQPNEALASAFVTDIAALNTPPVGVVYEFIRFQVEFNLATDATGGAVSSDTPIPSIEFLRIPFRF